MEHTSLEDLKVEISSLCNLTINATEKYANKLNGTPRLEEKLIVEYYSFTTELLKLINRCDSILIALSINIQQSDMANNYSDVAFANSMFTVCEIYRKNIENFLRTTEQAKTDSEAFARLLRLETDTLARKTAILKSQL